jgi:hypothetical protein
MEMYIDVFSSNHLQMLGTHNEISDYQFQNSAESDTFENLINNQNENDPWLSLKEMKILSSQFTI